MIVSLLIDVVVYITFHVYCVAVVREIMIASKLPANIVWAVVSDDDDENDAMLSSSSSNSSNSN